MQKPLPSSLLLLSLCALTVQGGVPTPRVFTYDQFTDHFNLLTQPQTFAQRVLVWDDNYQPGGPLLFYCGNEGDIFSFYNNTGWAFDVAPQLNAAVVFAEHRYYGESLPFGSDSFNGNNIGLLSVEQALADYAEVISYFTSVYDEDMKVVAFGGSYGGMLAAWFRIKYPNLVHMALAASAPLKFFSGEEDNYKFFGGVTNTFANADPNCPATVRAAFDALQKLAQSGDDGLKQITELFNLCNPITADHIEHLILWTVNSFTNLAMMDYPYPTNFLAPLPGFPVKVSCQRLTTAPSLLQGLRDASTLFYGNSSCNDIFSQFVECADQTGCGLGNDGTAWDYQSCAQLIHFPSTNNATDMFPPHNWTSSDLSAHCVGKFGVSPRTDYIRKWAPNSQMLPESASHIIFSNGLLDPWAGGGYLTNISDTLVAIVIPEGAHHLDLRGSNPQDPQSVIDARNFEVAMLKQWISEPITPKRTNTNKRSANARQVRGFAPRGALLHGSAPSNEVLLWE